MRLILAISAVTLAVHLQASGVLADNAPSALDNLKAEVKAFAEAEDAAKRPYEAAAEVDRKAAEKLKNANDALDKVRAAGADAQSKLQGAQDIVDGAEKKKRDAVAEALVKKNAYDAAKTNFDTMETGLKKAKADKEAAEKDKLAKENNIPTLEGVQGEAKTKWENAKAAKKVPEETLATDAEAEAKAIKATEDAKAKMDADATDAKLKTDYDAAVEKETAAKLKKGNSEKIAKPLVEAANQAKEHFETAEKAVRDEKEKIGELDKKINDLVILIPQIDSAKTGAKSKMDIAEGEMKKANEAVPADNEVMVAKQVVADLEKKIKAAKDAKDAVDSAATEKNNAAQEVEKLKKLYEDAQNKTKDADKAVAAAEEAAKKEAEKAAGDATGDQKGKDATNPNKETDTNTDGNKDAPAGQDKGNNDKKDGKDAGDQKGKDNGATQSPQHGQTTTPASENSSASLAMLTALAPAMLIAFF